ncbi:hypothetical protein ZWY2020_043882 [Hordeum vulgare]|nr:hypothetical protein ZWY2020_043882 [Hordeum vulgare]
MLDKRQRSMLMHQTTSLASMPSVRKQVHQGGDGDKQPRAGPSSSVSAGAVGMGTGGGDGLYPSTMRDAFAGLMITTSLLFPFSLRLGVEMSSEILMLRPCVPFFVRFGGLLVIFRWAPINLSCGFAM